jgi:alpha-ketoglutarate-dependent 2,4-dichlorophenoxyacetate dioxygenase
MYPTTPPAPHHGRGRNMLKVQPILPRFGAELSGVDISKPLSDTDRQAILDAMAQWGVCVFRNTGLDDESHIAFSRIFGHIELAPLRSGARLRLKHRELFDASNLDPDGNIMTDEAMLLHKKGDGLWHSDSSFMEIRSSYALLLCHEAPKTGGETGFADTRSAYDDLPQAMKDKIENLVGEHSLWESRRKGGVPLTDAEVVERGLVRHPVVMHHTPSGRKAIYVGAHTRSIAGMELEEGRALIRELIEWCTQPQYVIGVTYQPGDLSIWDNLCTLHRGGAFDSAHERRDMRRTTIRETFDASQPDDPFATVMDHKLKTLEDA